MKTSRIHSLSRAEHFQARAGVPFPAVVAAAYTFDPSRIRTPRRTGPLNLIMSDSLGAGIPAYSETRDAHSPVCDECCMHSRTDVAFFEVTILAPSSLQKAVTKSLTSCVLMVAIAFLC